jgi:hypothetical protein
LLRRALPAALAAAAFVLIPSAASATPEPAPVENYMFTGYYGDANVALADGRSVQVSLSEFREAGPEVLARLSVSTFREAPCTWGPGTCQTDYAGGSVDLSDAQVHFSRSLGGASVSDVPVTIVRWVYGPGGSTQVEEHVTVSVVLTGTGPVTRDAYRGEMCGDGSRECQSIRVESSRAAVSEVTFGDETVTGEGSLSRGHSIDAAAPKFDYAEN